MLVFLSNFMNHHMLPLCLELDRLTGHGFRFIATEPLPGYRRDIGYEDLNSSYDFIICSYKDKKSEREAMRLCRSCDMLIYGSAPLRFYIPRLLSRKPTFRFCERVLKTPTTLFNFPVRALKYLIRDAFNQYDSHLLLAASAFAAYDFNSFGAFKGRCYKMGYFPQTNAYEIEALMNSKKRASILWAGRMIDWKHPLLPVETAAELKKRNIGFSMTIVGGGDMADEVSSAIERLGVGDLVEMCAPMSPSDLRELMEKTEIYLFTSDKQEGWGAVLNEAMNSGCAAVAYREIGSVPFLLRDGWNGFIFRQHDPAELADICERLINDRALCRRVGKNAFRTITDEWNAKVVAERLVLLARGAVDGELPVFESGPFSEALPISSD